MKYFVKGSIIATGKVAVNCEKGDLISGASKSDYNDTIIINGDLNIDGDFIITDNSIWMASNDIVSFD